MKNCTILLLFLFSTLLSPHLLPAKVDAQIFADLAARSIGPAGMSGRIAAIEAVPSNPDIIYVGAATGGVWKTCNGGITWEPIFDEQATASIGAIAVCQTDANIVWVGTGEGNLRNSAGVGRGIYKSSDAGKTWTKVGLEKSEHIARIVLHPQDPDVAFVAALGSAWGENPERGVFKTVDGGKTWSKVLYVDAKTGAADLVMAPDNPHHLLAAMWEYRRWPWFFRSGGAGSGLYSSGDNGEHWTKLSSKDGLPEGELGRCGLAYATGRPQIAYALVEATKSVLLRSEDGGYTWHTVNRENNINDRPFYYADIRVNPCNENIVYSLQSNFLASEDGGKSFHSQASFRQSHSDYHALWLHPDGETLIVGNDGGVVISHDRGKSWQFIQNLPLAQYYHVSFDMDYPYHIYGGLQDNGSWIGLSANWKENAILNHNWVMVGFGDGFATEPDPQDSRFGYCMSQAGELSYYDLRIGTRMRIKPTETEVKHRYNWNAALAIDPFDPATIYYGSQFVHRSPDKGKSWAVISPDLTTNDPAKQKQMESGGLTRDVTGAENYTTILAIAPSPLQKGVLWVGTDDGHIQLSRDGGKSWQLVAKPITGSAKGQVPPGAAVPHIEASKFAAARAYVVFDNHSSADWTPYVFVTNDYGLTWNNLATPTIDGFAHVIKEDPVQQDLLFLGTEFGLYFSLNRGREWLKWSHGLPTVSVYDLAIHPRENDLIIATHGRSLYIVDDITPLRQMSTDTQRQKLTLFPIAAATLFQRGWIPSYVSPGDATFKGKNRTLGAYIAYDLNLPEKEPANDAQNKKGSQKATAAVKQEEKVKIEIVDQGGKVIRELTGKAESGIHRVIWDLSHKAFKSPEEGEMFEFDQGGGLAVLPGTYKVKVSFGSLQQTQSLEIKDDPRLTVDTKGRQRCFELAMEIGGWLERISDVCDRIRDTRKAIQTIQEATAKDSGEASKKIQENAVALDKKIQEFSKRLTSDKEIQGIIDDSDVLVSDIYTALDLVQDSLAAPTQAALVKYEKVKARMKVILEDFNRLLQTDIAAFKKAVEAAGITIFPALTPIALEQK